MTAEQYRNLEAGDFVIFNRPQVMDYKSSYTDGTSSGALSIRRGTIGIVTSVFVNAQKDSPDYKAIDAYDWETDEYYEQREDELYSETMDFRAEWDYFDNEDNQDDPDQMIADDSCDWCINSHEAVSAKEMTSHEILNLFGYAVMKRIEHYMEERKEAEEEEKEEY